MALPLSSHDPAVRQTAFEQCVQALTRTLATTPVGWALILAVCHDRVAWRLQMIWVAVFALSWGVNLLLLAAMRRAGPAPGRHGHQLLAIAALDGAAWGLLALLLMGPDAILNAWLAAILCGVSAVNAPVYITWVRAFHVQSGALWLLVALATALRPDRPQALVGLVSLGVFLVLMGNYMHRISARVVEGIRLQIANAGLAEQLRLALASSRRQAATDPLTELPNRRALDELLTPLPSEPLTLLMLDLDHFKAINDAHGHATGDEVLRGFAERVRAQLRPSDVCARWGGEEFVVLLFGTTLPPALEVAERLRRAVAAAPLSGTVAATVSIGAASLHPGESAEALLARADAAVYLAKNNGRNRVEAQA